MYNGRVSLNLENPPKFTNTLGDAHKLMKVLEFFLLAYKRSKRSKSFLELNGKQAKRSKIHIKANFVFRLDARYGKWFGRWDATHLLHDVSLDSSVMRQCECIMTWDKCELIRPLMMVEALYYYNRQ